MRMLKRWKPDLDGSTRFDFGVKDAKGREIGARVRVYRVSGAPGPRVKGHGSIEVYVQPTRDGEAFGACAPSRRVEDRKAAIAEVERRLVSMIKRYAKQANLRADGCHARWTDRETGVTLTIRDADDPEAGRYDVVCEKHATCVAVESKAAGRSCSSIDFCDECREAFCGA